MLVKKQIFLFSLTLIIFMLFSTAAFASEKNAEFINLSPSEDCYIELDSVQILKQSEQEVVVKVSGHGKSGDAVESFDIEINEKNQTYKTTKKDLSNDVISQEPSEQLVNEQNDIQANQNIEPEATFVNYSTKVGVLTEDPVQIDCCKTLLTLNWTVDVEYNRVTGYSKSISTWDGQPTLGLTYWYLDSKGYGNCGYVSWKAYATGWADHYNYDFGDNNLITEATHTITINGYDDGTYDYTCLWSHTGEAAGNLHGSIVFK